MSTFSLEDQFAYVPRIEHGPLPKGAFIVGGMGGSGLPARAVPFLTGTPLIAHRTYGLPQPLPADAVAIAVSYSGNTEETLSFFRAAQEKGIPLAAIASGGELLKEARKAKVPLVAVPAGLQPRDALLYMTKALIALLGEEVPSASDTAALANTAHAHVEETADFLMNSIPLIYASTENEALGYIMKITLNETGKIPAFANVFPELNHNEMQGLDPLGNTAPLSARFSILILQDPHDDARIRDRMERFAEAAQARGLRIRAAALPAMDRFERLAYVWMLARGVAARLAGQYEVPADEVPFIEAFKESLAA